jgi:hypothetical protein
MMHTALQIDSRIRPITSVKLFVLPSMDISNSKISQIINTALSNMTGSGDLMAKDSGQDIKDYHDEKHRITSDFGVKQSNTDDW